MRFCLFLMLMCASALAESQPEVVHQYRNRDTAFQLLNSTCSNELIKSKIKAEHFARLKNAEAGFLISGEAITQKGCWVLVKKEEQRQLPEDFFLILMESGRGYFMPSSRFTSPQENSKSLYM